MSQNVDTVKFNYFVINYKYSIKCVNAWDYSGKDIISITIEK